MLHLLCLRHLFHHPDALRTCVVLIATLSMLVKLAAPGSAATVVVPAKHDASIFRDNPNNASGGGVGLHAGTNGSGALFRALVSFDLSDVPAGSTIQSAVLTMYLGDFAGGGGGTGMLTATIGLHRVAASWGEAGTQAPEPMSQDSFMGITQGEPAEEGDVTWNARFHFAAGSTRWTAPGGDFSALASASHAVGRELGAAYQWPSTPAVVNDVQSWLDNPATNNGWLLVNQDETSVRTFRAFYSRNATTTAFHPTLTITFEPPSQLSADFDADGDVDGDDFLTWQRGFGRLADTTTAMGDANRDGAVDALDFALWRSQFGGPEAQASTAPEPGAALLVSWAAALALPALRDPRRRSPRTSA